MRKEVIWQRNMSALEVREELLEAKGTELRARSLRAARNMAALPSGALEARPGLRFVKSGGTPRQIVEIAPATSLTFAVVIYDNKLEVLDDTNAVVFTDSSVGWTSGADLWVVPSRTQTIIGDWQTGIYVLAYDISSATFSLGDYAFDQGAGTETLQPYWSFFPGTRLTPSAVTGAITVTASGNVFEASQVGTSIRWHDREIRITGFTSATQVSGTVASRLPPSWELTVASTANMRVDDVVEQTTTQFQAIITQIVSATQIRCVTIDNFEGPDVGASEVLSFPSGSTTVTVKTGIAPQASRIWDEQLMSARRQWPRSATIAANRLVFANFPWVPNAVALSAAGRLADFKVGTEDDAAILRTVGRGSRVRHVVNAGDLLLLCEREVLVTTLRPGVVLTPSNFATYSVDERGASPARPVVVDSGVLFIDRGQKHVGLLVLDGASELRWTVRNLTPFHAHLIKTPTSLCGAASGSAESVGRAFVVNGDGTLVAISWVDILGVDSIGLAPWDTDGTFQHVGTAFGKHWAIVLRDINGVSTRFIERFEDGIYLDCATEGIPSNSGSATRLIGEEAHVVWRSAHVGSAVVIAGGIVPGMEDVTSTAQIGLNFQCEAAVWAQEAASTRQGTVVPRVVRFFVSVQDTAVFSVRCNAHTREIGGYRFGDPPSLTPPLLTDVFRVPVMGRRQHPDLAVLRTRPGPFRLLATAQEVQV